MLGVEDCSTRTLKPLLFLDRYLVGLLTLGYNCRRLGPLACYVIPSIRQSLHVHACLLLEDKI